MVEHLEVLLGQVALLERVLLVVVVVATALSVALVVMSLWIVRLRKRLKDVEFFSEAEETARRNQANLLMARVATLERYCKELNVAVFRTRHIPKNDAKPRTAFARLVEDDDL